MSGTNHALTGALIAMTIKQPALAIPLALLSHFLLDVIPHYNPPDVHRDNYTSHSDSWQRKMKDPYFKIIVGSDMVFLLVSLIFLPQAASDIVAPWITFTCMIAAIIPDFFGGFQFINSIVFRRQIAANRFDKFHVAIQWCERPWGIWVELVYLVVVLEIIHNQLS